MPETFILIPGGTSRQGTTLNTGKPTAGAKRLNGTHPISCHF